MAPILLDIRHIRTMGILFVVSLVLCFVGGYLLGIQHAGSKSSAASISELLLPTMESVQTASAENHSTRSDEPGENIDVDIPDEVNVPEANMLKAEPTLIEKKTEVEAKAEAEVLEVANNAITEIIDNASKEDAKYSIQVGLYGIKVNAERRVVKLIKQNLSGHLTDFVNSKGDTLFNVRFGYFSDKASVLAALENYQQKYTGEGYIIKLKRK